MYRKKLHTERFELKMSKDLRKIVEEMAKNRQCTINEVIRQIILEAWEN